jgi:anaerobic selenocysteine-containing dehydrogenase
MGINRRTFIEVVAGGVVGSLFTPVIWKSLDDVSIWTQNWSWIPKLKYGELSTKPSIAKFGASPCQLQVRTAAGRPYGVMGSPESELSKGGLDALSAGGAQMLFSPSRVKSPMKKEGDKLVPVSWEDAEKILSDKLASVKGKPGKIASVSGDETGTAAEALSAFVQEMGSENAYMMPGDFQAASQAWSIMGGEGQPGYDLDNSDFVLMVGADIMESWGPAVRNQRVFAEKRPTGGDVEAVYVYAGPFVNGTASVSDKWIPVQAGSGAIFCLGLAYHLLKMGAVAPASDFEDFKTLVASRFSPDKVEKAIGVKPAVLAGLAKQLRTSSAPLVICGSESGQGAGTADVVAGAALNMLLGSVNRKGGMVAVSEFPKAVESAPTKAEMATRDFAGYLMQIASGKTAAPDVLLVHEANPVYAMPQAETAAAAIEKVPFLVSFSTWMDETAVKADLILPNPHSFERFDDVQSPYGSGAAMLAACGPVVENSPFDCKQTVDVLLDVSSGLGIDLGYDSYEEMLKGKAEKAGADFDELLEGKTFVADSADFNGSLTFAAPALSKAVIMPKGGEITLAPYVQLNIGSATMAIPPLNCVTISEEELKGKDLFVQLNSATAAKLGVAEGSKVKLGGAAGECVARVHVNEGVMTGVVAAPFGLGHTAWDVYSRGKGDNINKVLSVSTEPGSGMAVWKGSKVSVAKI